MNKGIRVVVLVVVVVFVIFFGVCGGGLKVVGFNGGVIEFSVWSGFIENDGKVV